MFGYLRPFKEELRIKDIKKYSSYYCALCNEIRKKYGRFWTFFLNYESIYILIFLESCTTNEKVVKSLTCHINPLMKKKIYINESNLAYAAFINMFLLELKFEDNIYDEKQILYKILRKILSNKKTFKDMHNEYSSLIKLINEQFKKLQVLEAEKGTLDSCADTTAIMLSEIIDYKIQIDQKDKEKDFKKINYYIGKLVYILDAYEDYEKDIKKNQFNPIIYMEGEKGESEDKVIKIILLLKFCICQEINKIEWIINADIIENVLTFGIDHTVRRIDEAKKKNVYRTIA